MNAITIGIALAGAGGVVIVSYHRRKWATLLCLVLLAPIVPGLWAAERTVDESASATISVGNLLTAVVVALPFVCATLAGTRRRSFPWSSASALWMAFLLLVTASFMWSPTPAATILRSALLVAVYLGAWTAVRIAPSPAELMHALANSLIALCWLILAQAVLNPAEGFPGDSIGSAGSGRLTGIAPQINPNAVGFISGIAVVLLVAGYGARFARRSSTWQFALVGLVPAACLVLSKARTGWLATAAALIVVAVALRSKLKPQQVALGVIGVVALFGFVGAEAASDFAARGEVEREGLSTLTGRTAIWSAAIEQNSGLSVFGSGYYYGHRVLINEASQTLGVDSSNGDNSWLDIYLDVGAVGVALTLATVVMVWRSSNSLPGRVRYTARALLVFLVITSLANPVFHTPTIRATIFGVLIFLASGAARREQSTRSQEVPRESRRSSQLLQR